MYEFEVKVGKGVYICSKVVHKHLSRLSTLTPL